LLLVEKTGCLVIANAVQKASARYYSVIDTVKACGLEPFMYLRALFTQLPSCKTVEDYELLLPWNIKLENVLT
jgi:transposase